MSGVQKGPVIPMARGAGKHTEYCNVFVFLGGGRGCASFSDRSLHFLYLELTSLKSASTCIYHWALNGQPRQERIALLTRTELPLPVIQ